MIITSPVRVPIGSFLHAAATRLLWKKSPSFLPKTRQLARNERNSMVELIERAVEAYAAQQG